MNQTILLSIFGFFQATTLGTFFAIFLASWLPFVLAGFLFLYEWSMRRGETLRNILYANVILLTPATIALALAEFIKFITPSPRPFMVFDITPLISVSEKMGSFPSSHAAFFAALGLSIYFSSHRLGKWYVLAAFLVALGRVAVGVHFPIDVIVGLSIGFLTSFVFEYFIKFMKNVLS